MGEKVCKGCGKSKLLAEFYASKTSADRLRYECKICGKMASVARLRADPVAAKAARDRFRQRHPERTLEFNRKQNAKRRDGMRAYARDRYYANRGSEIARSAAYARKHAEHIKVKNRERYRTDPGYRARVLTYNANRQRFEQAGDLTADQWNEVWDSYLGLCVYCGEPAKAMDHVEPVVAGGRHEAENVAPACKSCNSRKRSTPLLAFIAKGGLRPMAAA